MISQGRSGAKSFLTVGAYCFGFFTVHISNVKVEPVFVGECFRAFCTMVSLFFSRHLFGLKIYMFTKSSEFDTNEAIAKERVIVEQHDS